MVAIAAGYRHSIFIKSNGSLWVMGDNERGQLGDGTFNNTNKPEQIISNSVVAIAAGDSLSLFCKSNGSLWAMGRNSFGELGDRFNDSPSLPEQIFPLPQPLLTNSILFKTNLQFNATCGFGGTFYLLTSTNIAQPLNQWTPVWTNSITDHNNNIFNATLTNAVDLSIGRKFYILQSQ
ncbi:MAG TPA: hypothetical protein VE344_04330 [Methylomirabilota bacterium]|nr:hypothetical protein [Methylomirabilota bacterium]